MELVKQISNNDCFVACATMISGYKYYEVMNIVEEVTGKRVEEEPCGVGIYHFEEIFENKLNKKVDQIKFESLQEIKNPCLLSLVPIKVKSFKINLHGVVYDPHEKCILDPATDYPISDINDYIKDYNVINCLEIK